MKKILIIFVLICFSNNIGYAQFSGNNIMSDISNSKRDLRLAAIIIAKEHKLKQTVKPLIYQYQNESINEIKDEIYRTLKEITGKDLTNNPEVWLNWWNDEGKSVYDKHFLSPIEMEVKASLDNFKNYIFISLSIVGVLCIFVIMLMVVFSAIGSNRVKGVKEITKQAEKYIAKSEEITRKNDKIINELDLKKQELLEFLQSAKEDNQSEIERFSEMLEKNLEHRMREIIMSLREKAEKELEQTLILLSDKTKREISRIITSEEKKISQKGTDLLLKLDDEANLQLLYINAKFFMESNNYEEASSILNRIIQKKSDNFIYFRDLGRCYKNMKRFHEAIEAFESALNLSIENPYILYDLAQTYALLKSKQKMLEILSRAIHIKSEIMDEAVNDKIFKAYWPDNDFKEITES